MITKLHGFIDEYTDLDDEPEVCIFVEKISPRKWRIFASLYTWGSDYIHGEWVYSKYYKAGRRWNPTLKEAVSHLSRGYASWDEEKQEVVYN